MTFTAGAIGTTGGGALTSNTGAGWQSATLNYRGLGAGSPPP